MNRHDPTPAKPRRIAPPSILSLATALAMLASANPAHASLFTGDTLDAVANGIAWVAIVIAPIIGITVFWLLHILPEKIAEKKKHPQTAAIQTLCLLSLFFGGLLWPLAWLWAYTKPVLYKMAYGTDEVEHHGTHEVAKEAAAKAKAEQASKPGDPNATAAIERPRTVSEQVAAMENERKAREYEVEVERLRDELADLKRQLGRAGTGA
jgi:hypothetical protein